MEFSILFTTVRFTLANKRRRYVPALCELDVKKEGGGGGGQENSAEAKKGERERKRHASVADNRRILNANWAEMKCRALIYTRAARDWREFILIYQVDSAIQPSNNWGLSNEFSSVLTHWLDLSCEY